MEGKPRLFKGVSPVQRLVSAPVRRPGSPGLRATIPAPRRPCRRRRPSCPSPRALPDVPSSPPPPDPREPAEPPRTATWGEVLNAVFWSFFGVRKGKAMQCDAVTIRPHQVVIVGVLAGAVFVFTLLLVVRLIIATATH